MMRHFKKEMAIAIQQGKKTMTTRYKAWKEQEMSYVKGTLDDEVWTMGFEYYNNI